MREKEIPLGKAEDLSDKQFGFLKPLYRINNIGKHTAWRCRCIRDNNIVDVRVDHLKEGKVISCGCYNKEKAIEHMKRINHKGKNMKDITGQRSGYLIALEPTEKRIGHGNNSHVVWKCQCLNPIHGNDKIFCEATTTDITTKNKTSCGCIKSKGETEIAHLLLNAKIPFETQKTFENCRFPNTNFLAKFDFYVNNSYLIEFDGIQHFKEGSGYGWGESLEEIQKRDEYKNQWCKEHNIPLIRISYKQLGKITIKDITLEGAY